MASQGTKRKRDHESSNSSRESPLTTVVEIMENAKKIMKTVTHNLDQAFMMHSDIISKINQMDKVRRKKVTMGIFGKSGDGKSSLLNAVLEKKDLLPSDSYGACTAIVTRVEANLDNANYIAEIELFSKEEWEKELKDLLRVLSDESEDRNDDLFEIAVEKITAVYGDDAEKKTLEELLKDDTFESETFSFRKKIIEKSDVSEFTNDVACYIQHSQASPGGWYWPLVKSVTIKIPDCHELLEHIVLVDIPGTGDCNTVRDDLWKSNLRECSFVWIVSAINRAIKDKEPWGILKHCIEELGLGGKCKRINFICTKTDEINAPGYMRSARLTRHQLKRNKDQKKMCILHRNEHAKTDVKERLEKSDIKKIFSTDNDFQVFTVSSNAFFDPQLNLEPSETDIPKLQDDLMILNKNIKRELTRDYVNEAKGVLSLIQSVQQDTEKKTNETRDSIHKELKNNLKKALNELDNSFDNIYRVLEQCLSKGVEKSKQSCVATTKDEIVLNKDGRRFHTILQALCKNGGDYLSRNREVYINLNKALAKNLHECLQEDFKKIFPVSGKTGKSLQEEIDKFSISQSVSTHSRSSMLRHIQKFIKTEETKLKGPLNGEIIDKKKDIYSSIQETIKNEMASCYEQAAAMRGTGSMKKRQDMLITTVDKIKHDMFNKAKMEMLKRFNNLKLYIKDDLESGLKRSMELSRSQTSNIKLMDVSRETEQLERLSGQLKRL